ncbi:ADP-ribosylglycohydrolase family protein [Alkaliphilus peptidifermentans]|uniref:ADP-ribosylglycohydrolase n=1 Tax=Alkaliphilus peptidifermentans DSM 18978 TaxID=1120976 RepID=A0A1G5FZP1_9FIRM|nr:ADP-ribosylglycohydrolase family protein [Alkaliphilus peptidifermentans]SCY44674.1 ADP-ribosylglycohydrolase [Alkaliphilus peptidifermentans DSM 18978]
MIQYNYLEKTYAGFLGMNIGIRLGAPVEPTAWTSERIQRFYGNITGYVKDFKNFAADDDVNGPVFFLRALYDDAKDRQLTPQDVANAWLNYTREGVGMFWWGGYGVSTEHTAYLNLKTGIPAPKSGSAATNGIIMAEQIGGQIFIDTWGLVFPGNIERAAEYASIAASVSHDGNGIYGAAFIAACIAAAYNTADVDELIDAGLSQIPTDCTYAKVVNAVRQFHKENPEDFRLCLQYLQDNWGYDKYQGICHIIPNAGVCVLAMLYGKDFNRSVEITTMCGWDTDCNAGNVGTIMGVACGLEAIAPHYRNPINDSVVLSGISGYLNILDIPTYVKEIALLGYRLAGESAPEYLVKSVKTGEICFDFDLPGSTHNLRLSNNIGCSLRHSTEHAYSGSGSAEILFDRMSRGQKCKIYYKPFYRREDFDDERYMPVFSPTAYPGQRVSMMVYVDRYSGESIILNPYVRNTYTKEDILLEGIVIKDAGWKNITFTIPQLDGAMVDEVGLLFEANSPEKNRDFGCLYIDDFSITGKASYTIDITKQKKEFASITPFSHNHGAWEIAHGVMEAMCLQHAEAMTGNYFMTDVRILGRITPHTGKSHLISARVQGALRGYYAGFIDKSVAIFCNNNGMRILATCSFHWEYDREYSVELTVKGELLTFSVDGKQLLQVYDNTHAYGMAGYAMYEIGRSSFGNLTIEEL